MLITDRRRILLGNFASGVAAVRSEFPRGGELFALPGDSSVVITNNGWRFLNGVASLGMLPTQVTDRLRDIQHETLAGFDD